MNTVIDFESTFEDHKNLVFRFFLAFSRFEHALKRSGFASTNSDWLKVDWDKFSNSLQPDFFRSKDILDSIVYYLSHPPKKQIPKGNSFDWKNSVRGQGEAEPAFILRLLRTTRNNLFHGGKFSGPVTDIARDTTLLKHGVEILSYCIESDADIRNYFLEQA